MRSLARSTISQIDDMANQARQRLTCRIQIVGEILAPQVGLEPTTLRLTAECSAIELLRSVLAGLSELLLILKPTESPSSKAYPFPLPPRSWSTASAALRPEARAPWMEAVSR